MDESQIQRKEIEQNSEGCVITDVTFIEPYGQRKETTVVATPGSLTVFYPDGTIKQGSPDDFPERLDTTKHDAYIIFRPGGIIDVTDLKHGASRFRGPGNRGYQGFTIAFSSGGASLKSQGDRSLSFYFGLNERDAQQRRHLEQTTRVSSN